MTKALVTMVDGAFHETIAAITLPSFERYAQRHGYDLIITTGLPDAPTVPWSKPTRVLQALDDYDFVAWIDVDAVVADDAPDISDRLLGTPAFQAFVWLPYSEGFIATGVWALRRCPQATAFITDCLAQEDLLGANGGSHEAEAIWRLLDTNADYALGTTLLNERWNSRTFADAYIYHATGSRERREPTRRLNLLRAFAEGDHPAPPSTADPSQVTVVFDTDVFLDLVAECALAATEPSLDRFTAIFDLLTANIPGLATPELTALITARLAGLAFAGSRQ